MKRTFTGFSTVDTGTTGNWRLYDDALIVRDLLNHFHTRKGERRMRPDFGCGIWDMLMEPMVGDNVQFIHDEARRVCEADARVAVIDTRVIEYENGVRVEIQLLNRMSSAVLTFSADFERRESERAQGALA